MGLLIKLPIRKSRHCISSTMLTTGALIDTCLVLLPTSVLTVCEDVYGHHLPHAGGIVFIISEAANKNHAWTVGVLERAIGESINCFGSTTEK